MIDRDAQSNGSQAAEADHRIANHLALLACYVHLKGAELVRRENDFALLFSFRQVQTGGNCVSLRPASVSILRGSGF